MVDNVAMMDSSGVISLWSVKLMVFFVKILFLVHGMQPSLLSIKSAVTLMQVSSGVQKKWNVLSLKHVVLLREKRSASLPQMQITLAMDLKCAVFMKVDSGVSIAKLVPLKNYAVTQK